MTPADSVRLRHMLEAARKAQAFTSGHKRGDLDNDELRALALVRLLEIIGEAAKNVPASVQQQASGIPWRQIAGARDRLTHGYFDVDLDIVWQIIVQDLPPLIRQLEALLATE